MTITISPYLGFGDNAHEAMEFYRSVFGGQLDITPFGAYGTPADPADTDKVMHSQLVTAAGPTIFASDTPAGMERREGSGVSLALFGGPDDDATLRALGYGAFPVAVSVILEAALLSVVGALIGAGYAWLVYDGVQSGFGQNVFHLSVSPAMIGMAVLWAVVVAFLGGLLPSIRAARRPVVEALRAT